MQAFTGARTPGTPDEIWLIEHQPVFTLGHASRPQHLLAPCDIPVVPTERGGQVTYHGPGQALAYTLIDLRRRRIRVHDFVHLIERAVVETLARYKVMAKPREDAPGVYVSTANGAPWAKIASVGIKVSRGCTYHGVALNVAMDLEPFSRIDPCGFPGLAVTDLRTQVGAVDLSTVAATLGAALADLIEGCS